MPDRPARRQRRRRRDDGIGVDAVVPIKLGDRAGLPEMLHAERAHAMAVDGAEPEARTIIETTVETNVERAGYMPLFVAPQPVEFDRDSDDDDDGGMK